MKNLELIKYEAPEMEVLEVMVECGFAASPEDQLENPGNNGDI